jgi:hypothetical protein
VRERERANTFDDCNTTGAPGKLKVNRSGRSGLKGIPDVAVGEDLHGVTVS